MKIAVALVASAFLSGPVVGQIHKCKGPDGRITISDLPCPTDAKGEQIQVRSGNSMDSSADRRAATNFRQQAEFDALSRDPPDECRFEGKSKRTRELAPLARQECVGNLLAEKYGGTQKTAAQQAFRDEEEHRKRLVEGAAAGGARRSMLCTNIGAGMARCK